ncbi:uncharacterized protein L199_006740 [Kwoniella botswanensis]|uniref:uncharacterized protein n=1 Tax=Kwoniella botswanensis TaxID=1268659 RepID=UPI00315DF305
MTSTSTSSFPEIYAKQTSCLQRNVTITLSPVSSTKQHPLTVSIEPDAVRYPTYYSNGSTRDDHPFSSLGDNLHSSTTYQLYRADQILLRDPGQGSMLHVPRTSSRSSGGVENRWQMIDPEDESIRPYLPTQQETERVSQMIEKERNDPLPRDTPNPRIYQMTLDSATDKSIDTLAVVRPGYTILIPSNDSAENDGIGKKSRYLLLDEDIDFTNADENSAKRFEGNVTSFVESIATPIELFHGRDDTEPKSLDNTSSEKDDEISLKQALGESRISYTDENQGTGDDGSKSNKPSWNATKRSKVRPLTRFLNYLHSKTR